MVELVETRGDLDRLDHRKHRNSITGNTGTRPPGEMRTLSSVSRDQLIARQQSRSSGSTRVPLGSE
jgi:hypothetical protein